MRARAARVRESRGSVLRLRGGDPDLARPRHYSEFSRKGFPVDRKAFTAGVCREFARARRRGNDSYPFVLWDANIRVACDVEPGNPLHRGDNGLHRSNHVRQGELHTDA